ncbi:pectinesterase family protein [Roseimarinus sediminis]|uniref:pectinesterase family protein n=1 Tax=Roseimarinus sediminis TaxID=1610899 RepID=UPI003D221C44
MTGLIKKASSLFFLIFTASLLCSAIHYDAIVANDGTGTHASIGDALRDIPANYSQRHVIFVKNGSYNEKIRIENDHVTLLGESREGTTIWYDQLKTDWDSHRDYEGPAVVNIHADDVILSRLTIENTQPLVGKDAFAIYSSGTRTILSQCTVNNSGSNSVQLYNTKNGLYYINNCHFSGAVDFVKVCGNALIENSTFFQHEAIGSLWHGAFNNENEKVVVKNCLFDGVEHFFLGRHHYDACYYFLNCRFSEKMADKAIYRKTYNDQDNNRPHFYADRHYFHQCEKEGEAYSWYQNNLNHLQPEAINIGWIYQNQWDPLQSAEIHVVGFRIFNGRYLLEFDQQVSLTTPLILKTTSGKILKFEKGRGRNILSFVSNEKLNSEDLKTDFTLIEGTIIPVSAHLHYQQANTLSNLKK